jgi:hypothetical protein
MVRINPHGKHIAALLHDHAKPIKKVFSAPVDPQTWASFGCPVLRCGAESYGRPVAALVPYIHQEMSK